VRTAEDLQAVLLEELERIRADAREHVSLLYHPRKERKSSRRGSRQKTLQEDALQAYFYCRLVDRLPGRVLERDTHIILNREPLATKDQRIDIKVQAPTVQGTVVTVVVELKWSTNGRVSTSLAAQLARDYLAEGNVTHGIYLVGWSYPGVWKDSTVPGPIDKKSHNAWHTSLAAQAKAVASSHPEISIAPVVIDLAWPRSRQEQTGVRRRANRRKASHRKRSS